MLPLFIAILFGLISPSDSALENNHSNTTVNVAENNQNTTNGADGDTDTGGEVGQNPPPKID